MAPGAEREREEELEGREARNARIVRRVERPTTVIACQKRERERERREPITAATITSVWVGRPHVLLAHSSIPGDVRV